MSLASYTDLQTAVAAWLARQGDTVISGSAPDFITLGEARMTYGSEIGSPFQSKPLRIRAMETSRVIPINAVTPGGTVGGTANAVTLTPTTPITAYALGQTFNFSSLFSNTGAVTINNSGRGIRSLLKGSSLAPLVANDIVLGQTVQIYDDGTEYIYMPGTANAPLPANYLAMRNVYIDTNPRNPLEYITPQQANLSFNTQWPDQPKKYTIEADTIRLEPAPDTTYNLVCLYYQKFGALSAATNWLMTNAPNVYLYVSLLEATIFLQRMDRAQFYYGLFMSACNGLQSADRDDRFSGAPLAIKNDLGNP